MTALDELVVILVPRRSVEAVVAALKVHVSNLHFLAGQENDLTRASLIRARADSLDAHAETLHRALAHSRRKQ